MFNRATGDRVALGLPDAAPRRQALHEGDDAALHVGRADGGEDGAGHGSQYRWRVTEQSVQAILNMFCKGQAITATERGGRLKMFSCVSFDILREL